MDKKAVLQNIDNQIAGLIKTLEEVKDDPVEHEVKLRRHGEETGKTVTNVGESALTVQTRRLLREMTQMRKRCTDWKRSIK